MTGAFAMPRRLPVLIATLLAAVGLTVGSTTPAHAAGWAGPYKIAGYVSNKCIEDPGFRNRDGQYLDQWSCVNQWNEEWWLYTFSNGYSQLVLNDGAKTGNQMCVREMKIDDAIELALCNNTDETQI